MKKAPEGRGYMKAALPFGLARQPKIMAKLYHFTSLHGIIDSCLRDELGSVEFVKEEKIYDDREKILYRYSK